MVEHITSPESARVATDADRKRLLELAERCEREGPSEDLDDKIATATATSKVRSMRAYTTSIDAAVTLVPAVDGIQSWYVGRTIETNMARAYYAIGKYTGTTADSHPTTPALALCSAALRARAALLEETA